MANSRIEIIFHNKVDSGLELDFLDQNITNGLFTRRQETWIYSQRYAPFQVSASTLPGGSPELAYAQEACANYTAAFIADYGSRYNVSNPSPDRVLIESKDPNFIVSSVDSDIANPSVVEWFIYPAETVPINVVQEVVSEAVASPCSYLNLLIETDVLATQYESNGTWIDNTLNPFNISLFRAVATTIRVKNASGSIATLNGGQPFYYGKLAQDNIKINVTALPDGGTVTVDVSDVENLTLEYSLDGVAWFESNTFTAQPEGNYTMHVRDEYGCEVTKDYNITSKSTRDPYVKFSDANSFNWVLREEIDHCNGIYRNDTNSFGYESLALLPGCTETLISKCDPKITSQVKSNFTNVSATLRDEFGNEEAIPIFKMTANIDRFQSMDCNYYDYGDNKTGIYFTSGDTYDENGVAIGTYALNGNLPDFAVIGNYIEINGSSFQIQSILYDDKSYIQKRVIVVNDYYGGDIAEAIIQCTYDVLPFEVYQFDVDFSTRNVGLYDIVFLNEDDDMETIVYQTENINLATTHFGTVAINYYNTNNRDIFYKWGIENFIRVPYISIQAVPKEESSNNLSDSGANVVDSLIYRSDKIDFGIHEKSMMQKIEIATGCQFVFVNGVGYALDAGMEFEAQGQTNEYQCSRTMVQTGVSYNTRQTDNSGVDADYTDFNIPPFITDGSGFIKQ